MTREEILALAIVEHDRFCNCDPKYLMSCPTLARSILDVGASIRQSAGEQHHDDSR